MILRKKGADAEEAESDSSLFSGKREAVVEKIIKDIAIRIIQTKKTKVSSSQDFSGQATDPPAVFIYNTFTAEDGKVTRTLALEAADFLIKSIERLARKEVTGPETKVPERIR